MSEEIKKRDRKKQRAERQDRKGEIRKGIENQIKKQQVKE